MDDLIAFLRARLDEDETAARAATWGPWVVGPTFGGENNRVYVQPDGPGIDTIGTCVIAGQVSNVPQWRANAQHIARWDPERVLAEVEAKRALVDLAEATLADGAGNERDEQGVFFSNPIARRRMRDALRLLAQPHAEHPDYRPEWRS